MKFKYRVRWISSKRALLVLLWTLLVVVGCILPTQSIVIRIRHEASVHLLLLLAVLLVLVAVSAPLSGWLADAKFGNYKVFIVGAVLLFISTVMNCLLLILEELVSGADPENKQWRFTVWDVRSTSPSRGVRGHAPPENFEKKHVL